MALRPPFWECLLPCVSVRHQERRVRVPRNRWSVERYPTSERKLVGAAAPTAVAMIAFLVGSCGGPSGGSLSKGASSVDRPARTIPTASGAVFGLAWLKDGSLVFTQ